MSKESPLKLQYQAEIKENVKYSVFFCEEIGKKFLLNESDFTVSLYQLNETVINHEKR